MTKLKRSQSTQNLVDYYQSIKDALDQAMTNGMADHDATSLAAPMLELEARLADAAKFEDWLALYHDEACLWIPAHPDDHPGKDQALTFDDKRRLRERVWHMSDPKAWAITSPKPIIVRQLGQIAAWHDGKDILATSTIMLTHVRRGQPQILHGRQVFKLTEVDGGYKITAKILVLPELALGGAHIGWIL